MVTLMYLMATAIFTVDLWAHPTPRFEIAFMADQPFLSFFSLANMATAAGWQLLIMTHGNSCSPYMATTSFSACFSFFLRFLPRQTYFCSFFNTFFVCFIFFAGWRRLLRAGPTISVRTRSNACIQSCQQGATQMYMRHQTTILLLHHWPLPPTLMQVADHLRQLQMFRLEQQASIHRGVKSQYLPGQLKYCQLY